MYDVYGENLDYIDLTPDNADSGTDVHVASPPASQTRSAGTVARFRELAAIAEAGGRMTAGQVARIEKFRVNAYNDNTAEDEEEHWNNTTKRPPSYDCKDLA